MSFPRYPAYKDSGVEWLGEVPAHWTVVPLKHLVTLRSGGTPSKDRLEYWDGSIPWASAKDLKVERLQDTQDHITEHAVSAGAADLVPAGSVLVVVRGMILAKDFPVATTAVPMAINQDLKALTCGARLETSYLARLLVAASAESSRVTDEAGHGTKALRMETWTAIRLPVPPADEQRAIATFLDGETAKIDALVAEQQKLIELLKEKWQAVISHAVTKGLDPNVPMKDSGVEWLGEVPAHWEIAPLMWLTEPGRPIMYGIVLPGPDVGEGVPILKGGNVRPERLRRELLARTTPEIEAPYARARLRSGDLVYSIRGTIGDCEVVPEELDGCNITQDVARISPAEGVDAEWLRFTLLSEAVAEDLACGSLGAAVRGVNIYDLKRARIPVPPEDERGSIARWLAEVVGDIDRLVEGASEAITLLKERRSALISAAVTGRIDVRDPGTGSFILDEHSR